ncbi:hypothetical protein B0H21DRAFT_730058 [Amylocystis lapponica]|nr:hypothetical protein B0H21DRAFT_730058 [Amylocystis lapponica]
MEGPDARLLKVHCRTTFYLTGESYAGTYVPYIADYNPNLLDLNLTGIWISDPSVSWDIVQTEIPAVNFVHKYLNVFSFNQTFMAELDETATRCGYTDYFDKYVTYPPTGPLPLPGGSTYAIDGCNVWETIFGAALLVDPAFNISRIFDTYPVLWDVLGCRIPEYSPATAFQIVQYLIGFRADSSVPQVWHEQGKASL